MARSLHVPIHLDARLVTAPGERPPGISGAPFTDDGAALKPGVHLHWALPDALTRGAIEPDQALRFPAVPDRWLVVRFASTPPDPATPQHQPPPRTCTTFVVDAKARKSGRLGQLVFASAPEWLTVMGLLHEGRKPADSPAFPRDAHLESAYYPTARDRFGFHDTLADLGAYDPATLHLSYLVIGHYRSTREDPLARLGNSAARLAWIKANSLKVDLPLPFLSIPAPVHGDPYQAARPIDPAIVTAFIADDQAKVPRPRSLASLQELGITASPALDERLKLAHSAARASQALAAQMNQLGVDARAVGSLDDTTGVPDRLVCHGMLVDLGPAGRYNDGSDLDSTPRLAIADSASAAIEEAFLDIGGGELFAVLRGGIDGELGGAAGLQALPHHLHAAGFDAAPVPEVPPTEYVATLLDPGVTPGPDFLPVLPDLPANTIVRIVDRRRNGGPLAPLGCPVGGLAQLREDLTAPGLAAPVLAYAARKLALPRWHRPGTPVLHIEGHGRSFRHGHDGRMRADGRLPCRASGQTLTALELGLDIPSAGARITGPRLLALDPALAREPDFVRTLVHEAALLDPVNRDIAAGVWLAGIDPAERTQARADAASRAFADATELWWSAADPSALPSKVPATVFGTLPVPFAVNPWRDPWLPLFAEFDYSFTPHDASNTAALALDPLEPRFTSPSPGAPLSGSDRQALSSAPPSTLQSAIARIQDHFGKVPANQAALDELVVRLASLDMLTVGFGALDPQLRAAGHALRGGALGLPRLRLVDTFGRTRPPEAVPPRLLPPRLTHWARVQTRLVDAQARDAGPLRSPLAGVLVFDAVEQALEIFTATGAPLGQLRHDRGTHLAAWEPAPGRDGVPLGQLPATLAELAAAMLAPPAPSTSESAVAAVLKVLDRARIGVARRLTSDDPRGQLLRRPVLLMHACLTLELAGVGPGDQPDPAALAHKPGPVPVRLGSLDQLDDGLLGFFHRHPGSDTWKLHVVPAIASDAWPPQHAAHTIVDRSTTLALTPGVGVNVILLLDGPAAFHVQAGLLPRKRIETSEVVPPRALAHLQSTLRVGPVVMDPVDRRVAAPALPGETWRWIERDAAAYHDAPLAPLGQALGELPERPVTIRQGWLRLDPS